MPTYALRKALAEIVRDEREQQGLTREKAAELAADLPFPTFRDVELTDSNLEFETISSLLEAFPGVLQRLTDAFVKLRAEAEK